MNNKQYLVLKQPTRKIKVRLDLIDDKNNVVDKLEGFAVDGQIMIDSERTYRRSGNLSFVLTKDKDLIPSSNSRLWFDNRVGIHVAIENYMNEDVWFNLGRFALDNVSMVDSQFETIINLSLLDYMAFLDGTLGGVIPNEVKIVEKGITINQAIQSILTGLVDFSIEKAEYKGKELTLPYRIEKLPPITAYSLIKEIVDLYMGYEVYFDENGYFIFKKVEDAQSDGYIWDFENDDFKLNFQTSYSFSEVKNEVVLYGHTDNYGVQIKKRLCNKGFVEDILSVQTIGDGQYTIGDILYSNVHKKSYRLDKILEENYRWVELDYVLDYAFSVSEIGKKTMVINNDRVFNEEQALLWCEYELRIASRFNNSINFDCVPIFGLETNGKIKIKVDKLNIDGDYIVSKMVVPLSYSGDMNIQATKIFY